MKKKFLTTMVLSMAMVMTAGVAVMADETETSSEVTTEAASESAAEDSVTVTDTMGREVTVQLPVKSCYLGFYYENFLTIVGEDAFTKVTATSLYDTEGFFNTLSTIMRENVPGYADMIDVGSSFQDNFDVEKLIELDPDVVIVGNYQYNGIPEAMDKLEQAGIPVVCIDYSNATEENYRTSSDVLGKIFQCEDRENEILDAYFAKIQDVENRVANVTDKKTTFNEYCSTIDSFSQIGGSDYSNYCLGRDIQIAGGEDISEATHKSDADGNGTTLDMEYVLEQDPDDWFIVGGESTDPNKDCVKMGFNVTEDELLDSIQGLVDARPGFSNMKAVTDSKIHCIDNGILRTFRDFAVAEYVGKSLYPDLFENVDPLQDCKEFSEKYIPALPTDGMFLYDYQYTAE